HGWWWHIVELGRAAGGIEPAVVLVPDRPYIPSHFAVILGKSKFGWRRYLAHQRAQILARVHPLDGAVMDPLDRINDAGKLAFDILRAVDGLVTGENQLRSQRAELLRRVYELQG